MPVAELSRQHGFSQSAYDTWRKKYAGGDVSLVREHRRLSRENAELKKKLAEALLDNKALKYIVEKNWSAGLSWASVRYVRLAGSVIEYGVLSQARPAG